MHSPARTDAIPDPAELCHGEIQIQLFRILNSKSFENSAVLQSFLRFVTEATLQGRAAEVMEYTIATRALGRSPDFDSSSDTIVRTQAYRLRQKLSKYYASEGISDSLLIEIPKGHYIPSFSPRANTEVAPELLTPSLLQSSFESIPAEVRLGRRHLKSLFSNPRLPWFILVFTLLSAGLLLRFPISAPDRHLAASGIGVVDSFWRSFLQSDSTPIIAYTNSLYLITNSGEQIPYVWPTTGDRGTALYPEVAARLKKQRNLNMPGDLFFEDSITGVGDVLAATSISNAIVRAGGQPSLKRGRLLSTYDLENHNVVFVGSPFVNEILNDVPIHENFTFRPGTLLWDGHIDDAAASNGQMRSYRMERSADRRTLLSDYAVASCFNGLKQNREILMIGGLTTSGTAAAAEFVTSPDGIAEMSRRLGRSDNTSRPWPSYFEFLIKAQLSHGLDVAHTECVASHIHRSPAS